MTDEDKGHTDQKSFMQKHHNKHMPCYKCGKKGHYANKCPDGDNDDVALTIMQCSARLHTIGLGYSFAGTEYGRSLDHIPSIH
jgi:hypothetical protein